MKNRAELLLTLQLTASIAALGCDSVIDRRHLSTAQRRHLTSDAQAAMSNYIACAYASADTNARGPGTAFEVAEGAVGDCGSELTAYKRVVEQLFTAEPPFRPLLEATAVADAQVAKLHDDTRSAVVGRVLRARQPRQ